MRRTVLAMLCMVASCSLNAAAQQAPQAAPAVPAVPARPAVPGAQPGPVPPNGQGTPPISPHTVETPIPPPVVVPGPPPPTGVPNRPLTANEAVLIALRLQPNITVAQANILAAQGHTQQVRSALLPHLSLGFGYTYISVLSTAGSSAAASTGTTGRQLGSGVGAANGGTGTDPGTRATSGTGTGTTTGSSSSTVGTTTSGFSGSATLSQLIYDFNHTRDLVRQSVALERAATDDLTRVQSDLVLMVKQAYYQYLADMRLVSVNQENVANTQAQLDLTRARLNSGLGLPSDVVTAETAVSQAILNLTVAENNASVSRVNLALLMAIDPRTPLQVTDQTEPAFPSNDVNALVNAALKQRPEILEAQANIQANQYGVSAARSNNAPVISGNVGLDTRGSDFPPGDNTLLIGAAIAWDPFDGGLTAGLVKTARANLTSAQAQLQSQQLTVTSDVTQAYYNLRTAEQRVTTADIEVANAVEGVRIAEGRYRAGLGQFLDIINAQSALLTAHTNRVNAQAAVDQARAAIDHAIGGPLPRP